MSKDLINIDEFVRGKLGNRSEKEDPSAWLKMKALLDEEMPERPLPFYFRLRRPAAFTGAILLAGLLCVGGYKLQLSALRGKGNNTYNTAAANLRKANSGNARTNGAAVTAPNTNTAGNNSIADDQATNGTARNSDKLAGTHNAHHNTNTAAHKNDQNGNTAHSDNTPLNSAPDSHTTAHKGSSPSKTEASAAPRKTRSVQADASRLPAKTENTATAAAQNNNAPTETAANTANNGNGVNNANADAAATAAQKKPTAKTNKSAGQRNFRAATANAKTASSSPKVRNNSGNAQNAMAGTTAAEATDTRTAKKVNDSMKAVEIVNRQESVNRLRRTFRTVSDTVYEGNVPVEVPATTLAAAPPVKESNEYNTVNANNLPTAAEQKAAAKAGRKANKKLAKTESQRQENLFGSQNPNALTPVAADNKPAAAQKSGLRQWLDNLNLATAAAEAKRDVQNAKFYPGVQVGFNYSVSSKNAFQGVQFGPSGELVFNKHWSLFGAIRYFNRSGSTKNVDDSYTSESSTNVVDSVRGANYYFTVKTDSTSRFFNFSTVHSFELPISIRYAFRKFYLMTGINLAYYLPVNVELVEHEKQTIGSRAVVTNSTQKPILQEGKSNIASQDFGSRFGMGYLLGAGWRFAPAWQADVTLINSFWDNASGNGAKKLSKDFYRLPSVQLSIGYQFNRAPSKKATFGPTDRP